MWVWVQVGDYAGTERAATISMKYFDQLRGRGDGMWRDQCVDDLQWLKRAHQNVYALLCEAHKRLAYECWLVEVHPVLPFDCINKCVMLAILHIAVQSKLKRLPRRKKRGPKHVGYQHHIRQAMAVADAGKGRFMLDNFDGCENDTTGTQADWEQLEAGIELRGKVQKPLPPKRRLVSPTARNLDKPAYLPLKPTDPEDVGDVSRVVYICFDLPKSVDDIGIDPVTRYAGGATESKSDPHSPSSQTHANSEDSRGAMFVACGEEVHMLSFDAHSLLKGLGALKEEVEAEIASVAQKRVAQHRERQPNLQPVVDTDSEYVSESVSESESEDLEDLEPPARAAAIAAREEKHEASVHYPKIKMPPQTLADDSDSDSSTELRPREVRSLKEFTPTEDWIVRNKYWYRMWGGAGESSAMSVPKFIYRDGKKKVRKPTWTPSKVPTERPYYLKQRRERSKSVLQTMSDAIATEPLIELLRKYATVSNRPKQQFFKDLIKEIAEAEGHGSMSPRTKLREAKKLDDEVRRLPLSGEH